MGRKEDRIKMFALQSNTWRDSSLETLSELDQDNWTTNLNIIRSILLDIIQNNHELEIQDVLLTISSPISTLNHNSQLLALPNLLELQYYIVLYRKDMKTTTTLSISHDLFDVSTDTQIRKILEGMVRHTISNALTEI